MNSSKILLPLFVVVAVGFLAVTFFFLSEPGPEDGSSVGSKEEAVGKATEEDERIGATCAPDRCIPRNVMMRIAPRHGSYRSAARRAKRNRDPDRIAARFLGDCA